MSEKHPNEQEPEHRLTIKCWGCDHNVRTGLDNTHNFITIKQPWFNRTHIECLDEDCQKVTVLFHDRIDDKAIATCMQYPTSIFEFCDDEEIHNVRIQAVGAKVVEFMELSPRNEAFIARWGEFLQHVTVDVTDFCDEP